MFGVAVLGVGSVIFPSVICSVCSVLSWLIDTFDWLPFGACCWCSEVCGIEIQQLGMLDVRMLAGVGPETVSARCAHHCGLPWPLHCGYWIFPQGLCPSPGRVQSTLHWPVYGSCAVGVLPMSIAQISFPSASVPGRWTNGIFLCLLNTCKEKPYGVFPLVSTWPGSTSPHLVLVSLTCPWSVLCRDQTS